MRTKERSYPAHAQGKAARLNNEPPKATGRPSAVLDTRRRSLWLSSNASSR
jgi:hypothetical protein